jgi:hypothetical protein
MLRWGINGSTTIPTDHPLPGTRLVAPSYSVRITLSVIMAIICSFALFLLAFNVKYREHPVIKLSSPRINHGILHIITLTASYFANL